MFRKPNAASGVPIYVQLKQQILHGIEIGALPAGERLPGIRALAESLVINPNTISRVYHELEQENVLEVRHGIGVFVARRAPSKARVKSVTTGQRLVAQVVQRLRDLDFDDDEMRRLFEAELMHEDAALRR